MKENHSEYSTDHRFNGNRLLHHMGGLASGRASLQSCGLVRGEGGYRLSVGPMGLVGTGTRDGSGERMTGRHRDADDGQAG